MPLVTVPNEHTGIRPSPEISRQTGASARARSGPAPRIIGKSFHVRLDHRGVKERLSTPEEEHFLDINLLGALKNAGAPGSLSYDNPDSVIRIETAGNRAGMSLWRRAVAKVLRMLLRELRDLWYVLAQLDAAETE